MITTLSGVNPDLMDTLEVVAPSALEVMERTQLDVSIVTAKRFPRDIHRFRKDLESMATCDAATAAVCYYTLRRKDKDAPGGFKVIQGPSVRLVEMAVSAYGNIKAGARVISNDGKTIIAQGVCYDVQNNVYVSVEVQRSILTKYGQPFLPDMQVMTGNAACAIAYRNSALKVIPSAHIRTVFDKCKATAAGDVKTVSERRKSALAKFAQLGVKEKQIFDVFEVEGIDSLTLIHIEQLIGIYTAIQDGDTTVEEQFPKNVNEEETRGSTGGAAKVTGAQGITAAAAGTAGKGNRRSKTEEPKAEPEPANGSAAPTNEVDPTNHPDGAIDRDQAVAKLQNFVLDGKATDKGLLKTATGLKLVPQDIDDVWALPTASLTALVAHLKL